MLGVRSTMGKNNLVMSMSQNLLLSKQGLKLGGGSFSQVDFSRLLTTSSKDTKPFHVDENGNKFASHPADGPLDYGYMGKDTRFSENKPTIAYAKSMPTSFANMRHEQLLQLSVEGSYGAIQEVLTRNVMAVDEVEYDEAQKTVAGIVKVNRKHMTLQHFPYHVGAAGAVAAGVVSFPLVFDVSTAQWFNEKYVTTDMPPLSDLETYLEVGMWTWGWMEPILGQASFIFLVFQYSRNQLLNLGIKPYGNFMKSRRGDRLVQKFPQYESLFVRWLADAEELYSPKTE
jgi:hypothetical protein